MENSVRQTNIPSESQRVQLVQAHSQTDITAIGTLFKAYAHALGIDLSFQGFDEELTTLPGKYAPPNGVLILARSTSTGEAVGCVALRAFDDPGICEMKRLYVDPKGRGLGLGRMLSAAVVQEARRLRYGKIRLDSLADMTAAQRIYADLGFVEIPAYRINPIAGAKYFELDLTN